MENIIFSTKGLYPKTNVMIAFFIFLAGECILASAYSAQSVVFWVFTFIMILPLWKTHFMSISYINLCDEYVSGCSVPKNYLSMPCRFRLNYADITHVEIQNDTVKIYFCGGSYLVQTKNISEKVCELINAHKGVK